MPLTPEPAPLDTAGQALLKELMRPGVKIEAVIPANPTAQQLWATLATCTQGFRLLNSRLDRLKPIIGQILLLFKNKPSLYIELGYKSFEQFRAKGVGTELGLGKTTLWEAQVIANDWPQLVAEPDRYTKIGRAKMNIISKYAKGSDANAEAVLKTAEKMTTTELRQYSEQRGFIAAGECLPATIVINCNIATYQMWKRLTGDGRIHSIVGSAKDDAILVAMMENCSHEWIEMFEDNEREKRNETETGPGAGSSVASAG